MITGLLWPRPAQRPWSPRRGRRRKTADVSEHPSLSGLVPPPLTQLSTPRHRERGKPPSARAPHSPSRKRAHHRILPVPSLLEKMNFSPITKQLPQGKSGVRSFSEKTVFDTERGREPPAEKRDPGPRRPSSVTPWKTGPSARPGFPRGKAGCTAPQGANAKASATPAAEGPRRDGPSPFRASLKSPRNTWCFHQDTTPREPLAHHGAACTARLQWRRARHPHRDSRRGLCHAGGGGPPRRAP